MILSLKPIAEHTKLNSTVKGKAMADNSWESETQAYTRVHTALVGMLTFEHACSCLMRHDQYYFVKNISSYY